MSQLLNLTAADSLAGELLAVYSVQLLPGQAVTLEFVDDAGNEVPLATWFAPAVAYTDVRARAAQYNRIGSSTAKEILLTAEAASDYGTINGLVKINPAGADVKKVVVFTIGASGREPEFMIQNNANRPWDFDFRRDFVPGKKNKYLVRVGADSIEVMNYAR